MTRQPQPSFGSISHGTMRAEDLIPAFADALRELCGDNADHVKLCNEADAIDFNLDVDTLVKDGTLAILEELFDALDEYAPAYGYFGAHEGDGSDYGFWPCDDIDENFDGLKVSDLSEVPDGHVGEVLLVNGHGNCTLYVYEEQSISTATQGVVTVTAPREIWAIV
jgi:hypothetical protein